MRRILFLTCIGSLALALTAWGAPKERKATRAKGKPAAHAVSARGGGRGRVVLRERSVVSAARSRQRPARRRRGPAPGRSLAQALRVAVVLKGHEHAAHEVRWRLATMRQLIAREVSRRQGVGGTVAQRQHEHAAHKLRRRLVTARRLIAREVSLGQTLGNGAAQKRRKFAMSGLRGALEPLLAGTWR